MKIRDSGTYQLEAEVDKNPCDPFLRCNLACVLASFGDYKSAMRHLGIAMEHANGAMAAGCVSSAICEINKEFARLWQLPEKKPHLALVGG